MNVAFNNYLQPDSSAIHVVELYKREHGGQQFE